MAYPQTARATFGYQPPAYRPRPLPGTNGMAIASLILSLHGLGLPGLGLAGSILGHVGRRQILRTHEDGDGLAVAGIVIGWVSTAIYLALFAFIAVAILAGL